MAATPFRVKAVFDYGSQHEDDLSFAIGQTITVTDEEDNDWYYGEYPGTDGETKQGLFPRNFVERYEPTTPPRPSRSTRPKREPEVVHESEFRPEAELPGSQVEERDISESEDEEPAQERFELPAEEAGTGKEAKPEDAPVEAASPAPIPSRKSTEHAQEQSRDVQPSVPLPLQASKPPLSESTTTRSPPAPVAAKPSSSSFRDRIAAFNKPAAPPVPMKPGSSSSTSFIKKPYVPPPPSRDAFVRLPPEVPASKQHKAQEDPNAHGIPAKEESRVPALSSEPGDTSDQPKPTSLKERIALLQKQQLEQASRHAEAAQKKEKPKKPPKKRSDQPSEAMIAEDETPLDRTTTGSTAPDTERDLAVPTRPPQVRSKSKDSTNLPTPNPPQREFLSDPNDADQSAGGDTEDSEVLAGKRRADRAPPNMPTPLLPGRSPAPHLVESDESEQEPISREDTPQITNEKDDEGEEEHADADEDEDDVDPEVKRRMEIRDRMAKMSGGMGMAGMFGVPGGLPSAGSKKPRPSGGASKKQSLEAEAAGSASPPQPVPMMALPGMSMPGISQVRTPEPIENPMDSIADSDQSRGAPVSKVSDEAIEHRDDTAPDLPRKDSIRSPPRSSIDNAMPVVPPTPRGIPPVPSGREPPPPPPSSTRPSQAPPAIPDRPLDTGSDSDDELSAAPHESTTIDSSEETSAPTRRVPPQPPIAASNVGRKSEEARSPTSPSMSRSPTSPQSPHTFEKRSTRAAPPIPGAATPTISPPPLNRAPPPPPPPTRESDDHPGPTLSSQLEQDESEEVTEYEGDYDTDIAPGATHKEALKAKNRNSSTDDTLTEDEASYHHPGLPSLGPPLPTPLGTNAGAPRGAPPPPPNQPPKLSRQSSDAPRLPPPPPGQPPLPSRQSSDAPRAAPPPPPLPIQPAPVEENDYDHYNYNSQPAVPPKSASQRDPLSTPRAEKPQNNLYGHPGLERSSSQASESAYPPQHPSGLAPMSSPMPRQSLDVPRASTSRRSIDAARPSMEQGFMADDLDVGRNTQWWVQRKMPPPVLQDRNDLTCEVEESTAVSSSGDELVMKHVYALYLDYSQTILTARFSPSNPSKAEFNQRHQAPPSMLRQDQLENAHTRFGTRIAEIARTRENSVVSNGTPLAFVMELFNAVPDALPPIGTRAFGALIYTNLANASVQQYDEIRAGDIVSFRNAKLQGHRGGMVKQKYNIEVGKPDHVAIVHEWDGTRKKVRAWDQGRESKKVKIESFKLNDLRSGEVKIWRVVSREWVGWGRKS